MDVSPQQIRSQSFPTARKGYEPTVVDRVLEQAAAALESAQNHATAMEAKARAAVAKLQETSAAASPSADPAAVSAEQADRISRTLLLAQRAADEALAEARLEAERILEQARTESSTTIETTRSMAEAMVAEAREEARAAGADERRGVRSEVEALLARREFLAADVDHLEQFLVEQRARLRDAASSIVDVAERIPGGLGAVRAPLLSAAAEDHTADRSEGDVDPGGVPVGSDAEPEPDASRPSDDTSVADAADVGDDADDGDETQAMPVIRPLDASREHPVAADDPTPATDPHQLRLRPDLAGRADGASR